MPRHSETTPGQSKKQASMPHPAAAEHDAIEILSQDHKKVRSLFEQFSKLKESDEADNERKRQLVEQACIELKVHTELEEKIFYPAIREAIKDKDLMDEALVEHASAKQFIAQLSRMDPSDELYDAMFTVLGEYVNHHIEEEEKEMFKKARKSDADLQALGEALEQLRTQLMSAQREGPTSKHKSKDRDLH